MVCPLAELWPSAETMESSSPARGGERALRPLRSGEVVRGRRLESGDEVLVDLGGGGGVLSLREASGKERMSQ